jgi:hypothetical protein
MAWLSRRLSRGKLLRPGVTATEAAHVLWIATGFEGFDVLYTGRGLSVRKTGDLLVAMAQRTLIA